MRSSTEKPWAKLRMSRKTYETHRFWKKCGMERKRFETVLLALPDELIEQIYEEAHAEKLVEALFGKLGELKD